MRFGEFFRVDRLSRPQHRGHRLRAKPLHLPQSLSIRMPSSCQGAKMPLQTQEQNRSNALNLRPGQPKCTFCHLLSIVHCQQSTPSLASQTATVRVGPAACRCSASPGSAFPGVSWERGIPRRPRQCRIRAAADCVGPALQPERTSYTQHRRPSGSCNLTDMIKYLIMPVKLQEDDTLASVMLYSMN